MGLYTIIRIYEVPGETRQQATDRMLESLVLHVERNFHVKDIIRDPGTGEGCGFTAASRLDGSVERAAGALRKNQGLKRQLACQLSITGQACGGREQGS